MSNDKSNQSVPNMFSRDVSTTTDEKDHGREQSAPPTPSSSLNHVARDESDAQYRDIDITLWRWAFLCVGICLGLFMAMIDSSIVATSLFTISKEFGDASGINWVALAYTLAFLGCSVFFARMADVVGRRNAFVTAFIIFFSFSIGCGFCQSTTALIACRAFQGIGGSGLFSVTMVIFPECTPPKLKNRIAPIIGATISTGGVLGPVLGGVFTEYASWRWVFWINGPIGFVAMVLFYIAWPKKEHLPNLERRSWRDLDFVGSFMVIASAVLVTFAFQNAGVNSSGDPWAKAVFIGPLIVGILCWIALAVWVYMFERLYPRKMAAIPSVLVRNHVFAAATLNTIFFGFAFLSTLYAMPLRLQVVNGKSPITSGVLMLPMLGATGVGSVITGFFSRANNRLFETMLFSTILVTIGLALETTVSDSPDLEPKFMGFMVFIGLGYGMITSSATMMTIGEAPISEHAPAQGLIAQARMLGGSIGIAMSSAVLAAQQRTQIGSSVSPSSLEDLQGSTITAAELAVLRKTYNDAFTETMKVCAIVAGIGILLTMGTYSRRRMPLEEHRKMHIEEETARRMASRRVVTDSQSSGRSV